MGCCGKSAGTTLQYEVKLTSGEVKIVSSVAEARIVIATGGGGSYRAVPKTE